MDMDLSGLWIGFFVLLGILVSVVLVVLKLCGVLLLSWWWVLSPFPIGILVMVLIAGCAALVE